MELRTVTDQLVEKYREKVNVSPLVKLAESRKKNLSVDYFDFYRSVSSVYSSKIEGEDIDFDSYYKHKFLKVKFKPDYTRRADDLYEAYNFIDEHQLTFQNLQKAHAILSQNLLPISQQGSIRTNPMFVINSDDEIEYVAASPGILKDELNKLFDDVDVLLGKDLDPFEIFYFAAFVHLAFVKIHPFQDGNGRAARLLEKWFLMEFIGNKAAAVQLEKNYYKKRLEYYANIRKIGFEYQNLDYTKALDFLLMTALGIDDQ